MVGIWFMGVLLQPVLFAQEQREWTSTTGTKISAKLVGYTQFDVQIENAQGKRLIVARDKFSDEDQEYLKTFAALKSNGPSRYAPAVRAGVSMRGFDGSRKKALITLNNASGEDLENVFICWSWVSSPVNERIELKRNSNLRFFNNERMETTMRNLETISIESDHILLKIDPGVTRYEDGFIVQVYYEDTLIAHYATKGTQKELAKDPELRSKIGNGPSRARSTAKTGLGGATLK